MHEASIAQYIIEDLERRMEAGEIDGRVRVIHLTVGRLTTVVPDHVSFLFEVLAKGTLLEGTALEIDHVPVRVRCSECRTESDMEDIDFRCARCLSSNIDVIRGRELEIESVEVA